MDRHLICSISSVIRRNMRAISAGFVPKQICLSWQPIGIRKRRYYLPLPTCGKMIFQIRVIADITCDMKGSVPSSIRTTTFDEPYYDYNPGSEKEEKPFSNPDNITVMTIDNLPCGLPKEASVDFGHNIMKKVIPLLLGDDRENMIERATIAKGGRLTDRYRYLEEWVYNK